MLPEVVEGKKSAAQLTSAGWLESADWETALKPSGATRNTCKRNLTKDLDKVRKKKEKVLQILRSRNNLRNPQAYGNRENIKNYILQILRWRKNWRNPQEYGNREKYQKLNPTNFKIKKQFEKPTTVIHKGSKENCS